MGRMGYFVKTTPIGYGASQIYYFFGYKLHALCGLNDVIHPYDLSMSSAYNINYLMDIKPLYHDCCIFGEKGYISVEVQLDLFETANIRLESGLNAHTGSTRRTGSQPLFLFQRQERGWKQCFRNFPTNSSSSETTPKKHVPFLTE